MFWPHTRSVVPLMPPAAGEQRNAIASATSTGRPPCCSELVRRKIWRETGGIEAVMSVSMKPGATAFTVPPNSATTGASASVMPMRPDLAAP